MNWIQRAKELRDTIEKLSVHLPDEDAVKNVELFPVWRTGTAYQTGDRVQYEGILYSVLQPHTSQDDWTPDKAVSLFAKVLIPDPGAIPEWEQPESTNPYAKGDVVAHNGKKWESEIDGNVWEPGVYGWREVQ